MLINLPKFLPIQLERASPFLDQTMYRKSQKKESTLLNTYVLNEFLTADRSCRLFFVFFNRNILFQSRIFLRMYPTGQLFRDQLKFKPLNMASMMQCGLKKDLVLIEYSFTPFDMNFRTIWMPNGILTKIWSRNSWPVGYILKKILLQKYFCNCFLYRILDIIKNQL